ncbi:phosphopentomutase [Alicyclobacillus ferrooxydans]|uniref:Phosphopentomutase n=1 Tax=Alicyclobacillus ferrooxydans TaxID=471514 RepID=A0A0P9CKH8_9BACL|nr:phosphopentomutase [Alicyclobacillus ferrooxydans]KPV43520.1 phosphopentomutase [Alicyclobacillus ferrooxydans]
MSKRLIWIVLDSVGIGAAPDAQHYGHADEVSHTLLHIAQSVGGLKVPNLARLGLGCIDEIPGVECAGAKGAYGKMQERSFGKDTTNGHWEFVGVVLDQPMPVYPEGFPAHIIERFEEHVGKRVLGNRPSSGTVILDELGEEHMKTGRPIVYTSADSVFQIAAHEDIVPIETLYEWCRYARAILTGPDGVGRVIARPFIGSPGHFKRTGNRKDFSLTFGETVLTRIAHAGYPVVGIGKIHDIYGGEGITEAVHTEGNEDGMNQLAEVMDRVHEGVIYINLVDFDALYGHRNDPVGFAKAVESFDARLPEVLTRLTKDDLLCITADHGCDPTAPGTDHTREWVPLLLYSTRMSGVVNLGERDTFADIGATVAEYFQVEGPPVGKSALSALHV